MSITSIRTVRFRNTTAVRVASDLAGTVYYGWFVDGVFVGKSRNPERAFRVGADDVIHIDVIDTTNADYDFEANAPNGWPAKRVVEWLKADGDIAEYRVQQKKGAGSWSTIGRVPHKSRQWVYRWTTPRLDDLSSYTVQVVPYDAAGNAGSGTELLSESIVRRPDPLNYELTYDSGTNDFTVSAA